MIASTLTCVLTKLSYVDKPTNVGNLLDSIGDKSKPVMEAANPKPNAKMSSKLLGFSKRIQSNIAMLNKMGPLTQNKQSTTEAGDLFSMSGGASLGATNKGSNSASATAPATSGTVSKAEKAGEKSQKKEDIMSTIMNKLSQNEKQEKKRLRELKEKRKERLQNKKRKKTNDEGDDDDSGD